MDPPVASVDREVIEKQLAAAPDLGFRSRVMHEYGTIFRLVRKQVHLEQARVLDFGCGEGLAAASFALRHPQAEIYATDIVLPDRVRLEKRCAEQANLALPENLFLSGNPPGQLAKELAEMDLIYAWSVFEHVCFADLIQTMGLLKTRLRSGGVVVIQICPLFFSPRGSHLSRYDASPWAHLLTQHDRLKNLVLESAWPEPTKRREWEQFESLNRATAEDIVQAAAEAGYTTLFEERLSTKETPPARLLRAYAREALVTEEIRLVLQ